MILNKGQTKVNIDVENNEFIYKYMIIFYSSSFLIPIYIKEKIKMKYQKLSY